MPSPKPAIVGWSIPSVVEKNKKFTIKAGIYNIGETGECYIIIEDKNKNKYLAHWHGILESSQKKTISVEYSIDRDTTFQFFSGYIENGRGHIYQRIYRTVHVRTSPKAEIRNLNYPTSAQAGEQITITYEVYNVGGCPAKFFGRIRDKDTGKIISGSTWQTDVPCGKKVRVTTRMVLSRTLNATIEVGHNGTIDDRRDIRITVSAPPTPPPTPPKAKIKNLNYPTSAQAGEQIKIIYEVYNTGRCPARLFGRIRDKDTGKIISGTTWETDVPCNKKVQVTTRMVLSRTLNATIEVGHNGTIDDRRDIRIIVSIPSPPPECTEGETKCVGYDLYKCINGKWQLVESNSEQCGYVPPECTEGETKCVGYDLYKCINGKWQLVERNSTQCGYTPPAPPPPIPTIPQWAIYGLLGLGAVSIVVYLLRR